MKGKFAPNPHRFILAIPTRARRCAHRASSCATRSQARASGGSVGREVVVPDVRRAGGLRRRMEAHRAWRPVAASAASVARTGDDQRGEPATHRRVQSPLTPRSATRTKIRSMRTLHVAITLEAAGIVDAGELARVAAAIQRQVMRDFAPAWGIRATVDFFPLLEAVPADYWPVVLTRRHLGRLSWRSSRRSWWMSRTS